MKSSSPIPVLWSDENLLVVNKPAGLLTLPDGYDAACPCLVVLLKETYGRLWVVHRLDRDASGVIILARTSKAHQALSAQFEDRSVSKVYHALVVGNPLWNERAVNLPLRPDGDRRHRTVVSLEKGWRKERGGGKPALTHFRVLERFGQYALVEARPQTGRTHQIRVHLASLGSPVAVDGLYGDGQGVLLSAVKPNYKQGAKPERPLLGRLGLHAWALTIEYPLTRQVMQFEAPYPKDFGAVLRQLRKL